MSVIQFREYYKTICRFFKNQFREKTPRSKRKSSQPAFTMAQAESLETRQMLAADDLTDLGDHFDDATTIADWQRIYQTEGWNADQLENWDINNTQAGRMVLTPHTATWFESYRGPLVYKEITGDFIITTQVNISDRDDIGDSDLNQIPNGSAFSLAGLMIRTPRDIDDPALDWTPGTLTDDGTNDGENYIFLSLGYGNSGNQFQMETKTTRNSSSSLVLQDRGDTSVINLQIARIGENVFTLYQIPGEDWILNNRFHRPDLPETLQAGMVAYSDWGKVSDYDPFYHNNNELQPGGFDPTPFEYFEPDIVAGFEYIQFDRPEIPEYLQGIDLRTQTTNLQMLSFLGENVNAPLLPNQDSSPPMQVGMNLEGIADWSSAWTFTDMAHTMRTWISVSQNLSTFESQWGSTLFDIELDEHGWPMQTYQTINAAGQTIIQQFIAPILTGNVNPAGLYRAEWDGAATVLLPEVIEQGITSEGRNYAILDLVENQDILLTIRDIDPTNHFRNFNLWMPEYNGQSFVGQDWQPGDDFSPFHPLFLERLAPFQTLRFMDWMETNETDIVTWEDRAQLEDNTYHGGNDPNDFHNGIAPEYMIELANTLDANPWFNMPHQANDDFVRNFAELVQDTLDPELTVYVEWSNEIWNYAFGFHSSFWIQEQLDLPENAGMNWYEFAAHQMQQDFEIWQEVFAGQEDRIVRVVAGQQANPSVLEGLLPAMNGNFDAISVTAYAGLGFEQIAGFDENTTADDVIDTILEETIPWSLSRLIEHQNLADQYSQILGKEIDLVTYEGGSHPDAYGWPVEEVVHAASLSPRMSEIYQALLNSADLIGVDLFNQFVFTGGGFSAPWGDWGLLHTLDQPLEESFEYQAIVDFINSRIPEEPPVVAPITQIDLRITNTPTPTSSNGESSTLPTNISELSEWETFWVEVWASIPGSTNHGFESYLFDLHYNSELTTATNIEYGPAFVVDQTGLIDDENGLIQGVSARTNLTDVGDDQLVLLARIQFAPTENDQVTINFNTPGVVSYQADFWVEQTTLQLTNQTESQPGAIYAAEVQFWAVPYDTNDDDIVNFRDLIFFASAFGAHVAISNLPYSWLMDYNQSGIVDFRDLILFATNFGKQKLNHPNITLASSYPYARASQNLIADIVQPIVQPQQEITALTLEEVHSTAQEAIHIYSDSDSLNEQRILESVKFEVTDLPENTLATTIPGTILIDISAAGHGWFIDHSPWDHSEFNRFNSNEFIAFSNTIASQHFDFLTVILHELEHLLGHQHEKTGLMRPTLSPGIRRLPDGIFREENPLDEETDHFFSSLNDTDLLIF